MKISVCLATYNGEKYIKEQLESILVQLGDDDEVIISDDGSTDNTLAIVKSLNDRRIKIIFNNKERGYSKNFENSIVNSSGDIIFLCDQDDVWMDNKVLKMMDKLEKKHLVISDALVCDEYLTPTLGSHFRVHKTKRGFVNNWLKTRYIGACMAFRKEMLDKLLPFPKEQKLCAHDYWIANVGELYYKVGLLDIPLIKYRRHGANASSGGDKSRNSFFYKISVRLYTLAQLITRL